MVEAFTLLVDSGAVHIHEKMCNTLFSLEAVYVSSVPTSVLFIDVGGVFSMIAWDCVLSIVGFL